jgi:uncharacterized protein YukE
MGLDIVIPPMPRGDPGGMRELAGICKSAAAQFGSLGDDVTALPKTMTFEGRAANAFTDRMQSFGSQLADAAAELQDAAGRLESAAADVERQIAEREAAIRRAAEAMGTPAAQPQVVP